MILNVTSPWLKAVAKGGLLLLLGMILGASLHHNRYKFFSNQARQELSQVTEIEYKINNDVRTVTNELLSNPSHLIRFKGQLVATSLYHHLLVYTDNLQQGPWKVFDPKTIGKSFRSPHYLEINSNGNLLVINGWGKSIVEIEDLNGNGWKEFTGINQEFKAPHGLCVDQQGWIYVGDSLNSRLVRFKDLEGSGWQVFSDKRNLVAYTRQMDCAPEGVYLANSYEDREGLNPGKGGNILLVRDFESGLAEVVVEFPNSNLTGLLKLPDRLLWIEWGGGQKVMQMTGQDLNHHEVLPAQPALGVPYGLYWDEPSQRLLTAYFGNLHNHQEEKGGLVSVPFLTNP